MVKHFILKFGKVDVPYFRFEIIVIQLQCKVDGCVLGQKVVQLYSRLSVKLLHQPRVLLYRLTALRAPPHLSTAPSKSSGRGGRGGPDAGVETGSGIYVTDMCSNSSDAALQPARPLFNPSY